MIIYIRVGSSDRFELFARQSPLSSDSSEERFEAVASTAADLKSKVCCDWRNRSGNSFITMQKQKVIDLNKSRMRSG